MADKNNTFAQIKYGGIINYVLIGINVLLGLIYTPWILHEIGSSDYGLYTLASTLIAMFLLDFGMSAAVTRFISNFRAEGRREAIDSFSGLAIKFYIMICSIAVIILILVYFNINTLFSNLADEELPVFKVIFIITSFFVVICFPVNICNGILNAYEEFVWLKGSDVLNKVGTVIFTIIALLCHGGVYALVFINGFFNLLTLILKVIIVKKKTPVKANFKRTGDIKFKDIFSFSAWSTVDGIARKFMFNIIPSILASIANTMAITLFGFANIIEGYVYTISSALNGLFLPEVSRIVVKNEDPSSVLTLMVKVGRFNLTITGLLVTGLTIMGKEFVHLWVGDEYAELYYCILFLSFPYLVSATQQIGETCIIVVNKIMYSALIGVGTAIMNIILCIVLCPQYGVIGVCAGTGITLIVRIICLNIIYYRALKINILQFFIECHLKMLPALIAAFVLGVMLVHFWDNPFSGVQGWLILGVRGLFVSIIYLACMWAFGWNGYEKTLLKSSLKRNR